MPFKIDIFQAFTRRFVNWFLKYQYEWIIEEKKTSLFVSGIFLSLPLMFSKFYGLLIIILYFSFHIYILISLALTFTFEKHFGVFYAQFLKRHSDLEVFEKYFGNAGGTIKSLIKDPKLAQLM